MSGTFVRFRNTTTNENKTLTLNGPGVVFPPGSYECVASSAILATPPLLLRGNFVVRMSDPERVVTVPTIPVDTVAPFYPDLSNWLVTAARPPDGQPTTVRLRAASKYAIGLVNETGENRAALTDSLLWGLGVTSPEQYTHAEVFVYDGNETPTRMEEICAQFLADTMGIPNRAFVAGVTTGEFLAATTSLPRDVLTISLASTLSDYSIIRPNAMSMDYSDAITTEAIVLSMLYNNALLASPGEPQNVYILAFSGSLFADGYIADFEKALRLAPDGLFSVQATYRYPAGDTAAMNAHLHTIANVIRPNDIFLYIGNSSEMTDDTRNIFNYDFPSDVYVYMADTMDDVKFNFSKQLAYIVVPSFMDYTEQTQGLYKHLFSLNRAYADYNSYLCPFAFDATRQLNLLAQGGASFSLLDFTETLTTGAGTKAALQTNWVTVAAKRPQWGLFWFTQTVDSQWSEHLTDFNLICLGTQRTQRYSASNGLRIGKASWKAPTFYELEVMYWRSFFNADGQWIFTSQPQQDLHIDTDAEHYQSNEHQSAAIGAYNLGANGISAIVTTHQGKVQPFLVPGLQQWPMTVLNYTIVI